MTIGDFLPRGAIEMWRFLCSEFASRPGRASWALRIMANCLALVLLSMTFQVPFLALSIVAIVFYGLQPNATVTRLICIVFPVATFFEIVTLLVVLEYSYDYPLVRIAVSSLIFLGCMYLSRVCKVGFLFYAIGLVVMYGQTTIDGLDYPELALRSVLWTGAASLYPVLVLWFINLYLFPLEEPLCQLRREVHRQCAEVLSSLQGLQGRGDLPGAASNGNADKALASLRKLHALACLQDAGYRKTKAYWQTFLDTLAYLRAVSIAAAGKAIDGSNAERSLLRKLGEQVEALDASFARLAPYRSNERLTQEECAVADGLGLDGFCRTLQSLASVDIGKLHPEEAEKAGLFVPDATTNPVYMRFAVKTLLACLVCYVFYHAVQWDGIHTSLLTCVLVVMNPSMGAISQKITLRVGGAALGGVVALLFSLFLLPRADGIVDLLLMVAPVFFVGGWIAGGSERTAYIGVQMVTTFCLAFLEHFGPSIDLVEIRDRAMGILIGTVVSVVVCTMVWPESEVASLRQKMAGLMRQLGKLIAQPVTRGDVEQLGYLQRRMACVMAINECDDMRMRVSMEGGRHGVEWQVLLERSAQVLDQGHQMLDHWDALRGSLPGEAAVESAANDVLMWQRGIGAALEQYADATLASSVSPMRASAALDVRGPGIPSSSAAKAMQLVRDIQALPDWSASDDQARTASVPVE